MAIYHLAAKVYSRGKGASSVAAAAYRARCGIEDERTGVRHDYSRHKSLCIFEGIYTPTGAPDWTRDRAQLWNHVEAFEKRKDAQLAREFEIALPHELTSEQQRYAVQDWVRENFTRKGLVADVTIHSPHPDHDQRNDHAHIMAVMRKLDGTEFKATKERRTLPEQKAELEGLRESWEKIANRHLERHGHEARIDRRSLEAQGIDRVPGVHLGKSASEMEARGIETDRGDMAREAANQNERGEWIAEQIAEAEASTLAELETVQRERDQAAASARDEQEAETLPRHRDARPVFEADDIMAARNEQLAEEQRQRGDNSAARAANAMEDLARIDPVGTARNFGHHAGDRIKSMAEALGEWRQIMRGGISEERATVAAVQSAEWDRSAAETQADIAAADQAKAQAQAQERADQAAYVERQKAAYEAAAKLLIDAQAELGRQQQRPRKDYLAGIMNVQQPRFVEPAPEAVKVPPVQQAEPATPQHDLAAVLKIIDDRLWSLPPPAPAPQPAREPEQVREAERPRKPEPLTQAPEIDRPSLFQTVTVAVRNWWQGPQPVPEPAPQHPLAFDRREDVQHVTIRSTPAKPAPAQKPEPIKQQAPQPEKPRPAERLDYWIENARADLARERAAETQQQAERERREREEADRSRKNDGGRERTRYHHSRLWELFHPFHNHRRRDHHHQS